MNHESSADYSLPRKRL